MKVRDTRIADFAKVVAGGTPTRGVKAYYEGGEIPWIKTLDLNCAIVTETEEHITPVGLKSIRGGLNPVGSVMVAMYGGAGTIGKSGVLGIEAATNQAVASILPNAGVFDSDFLHFQLCHLRGEWMQYSQGNRKDPNINKSVVEDMLVWLPDRDDQKAIGEQLTSQLAAVEEARQAATSQLRELTQLANAIVRETLVHPDTESHSLGDVLLEVRQGVGSRWSDFPVLGATREGLAPAKEPVGKNPERYKPVTVGTVFYNPMRILIGSIAMVDEGDAPGITSPDYVALRGCEGLVDSRWFYYWLRSPEGERCIASLARGAVRERMLFNRLSEGEITLPPYPVQQAASRALAELRPMKAAIEARLREIERLPQRLLAQVFDFEEEAEDA